MISEKKSRYLFIYLFGLFAKTFLAGITFSLNGYEIKKAVVKMESYIILWSLHNMGINYTELKYRVCKHFTLYLFASF